MNKELEETIEYLGKLAKEWKQLGNTQQKAGKYLETALNYIENSISREAVEEKIKKIESARDTANLLIERKVVIADNDSLYSGEKIAHNYDITILKELLEGK